jgi:hypothetical protein
MFGNLIKKFEALTFDEVAAQSVDQTKDKIVSENLDQLYAGKNSTGQDITPSYFNDPYFKSQESAQRYSDWKDKITPSQKRKSGTPNLYINGAYHKSINVIVQGLNIRYDSSFSEASQIENKYDNLYGLGGEFKRAYLDILQPVFIGKIKALVGL